METTPKYVEATVQDNVITKYLEDTLYTLWIWKYEAEKEFYSEKFNEVVVLITALWIVINEIAADVALEYTDLVEKYKKYLRERLTVNFYGDEYSIPSWEYGKTVVINWETGETHIF